MNIQPNLIAACSLLACQALAQQAVNSTPNSAREDPVELSPFLVNAAKDIGYQAGNTTSGSRLNTSLKDTAATVQVFTPELIQDLGANNLADVLTYATAVQPDDLAETQNGRPDSGRQDFVFTTRGHASSRMLDFFNTNPAIDTYNTGRLEQSSGPNAVLFDIGAAGGALTATTNRALTHRSQDSLRLQSGSFDRWRLEGDFNQVRMKGSSEGNS